MNLLAAFFVDFAKHLMSFITIYVAEISCLWIIQWPPYT